VNEDACSNKALGNYFPLLASFVLYITFLFIFFSENKAVYVSVNSFGEAFVELLIFSVALLLALAGCISLLRDFNFSRQ